MRDLLAPGMPSVRTWANPCASPPVPKRAAFFGEGRGSGAVGEALAASERRAAALRTELELLKAPPLAWIEERVATIQEVLERRTGQSALILRKLLGTVRLEPARGDIRRPYFRAVSTLQVLSLLEEEASGENPEAGSTALQWWTRSQRIRTAGAVPFEAALLGATERPLYQRISQQVKHLHQLGLRPSRIAWHLGVTDKTAAKALSWAQRCAAGPRIV